MAKTVRKTQETEADVGDFVKSISDGARQQDCRKIVELMASATGHAPKMWGTGIVGFGKHHYEYADGSPAEICKVGFAPRARSFAFYLKRYPGRDVLLNDLGKHRFSGGCLHVTRLSDVDEDVLKRIVRESFVYEGPGAAEPGYDSNG